MTKKHVFSKSFLQMGTVVQFQVITSGLSVAVEHAMERALNAFQAVELTCSRFDETSELKQLCNQTGNPVKVSDVLFETLQFSLTVAEMTNGLFDPTLGRVLHAYGFHRHYLTGQAVEEMGEASSSANYLDVVLDATERTVTLQKPLTLDLGAVAKGFAVDLAAKELQSFEGFAIDAGGDVFVGGTNHQGGPWTVGIRHPIDTSDILCRLQTSNVAICTSGGYERKSPSHPGVHHLIHPETGESPNKVLSSTVIAPFGMMADAFSTVAFLMGCEEGIRVLEDIGLDALLVDEALNLHMTQGMKEYIHGE